MSLVIAVDCDGTIVDHVFPDLGAPVPGAFKWLKRFQELGALLILYTMRSDDRRDGGNYLSDAVALCKENGVEFWGHNVNPEQAEWTSSPKCYASIYVDDAAVGCPLSPPMRPGGRPVVDWETVGPLVEARLLKIK